jgi:hypothetical protein
MEASPAPQGQNSAAGGTQQPGESNNAGSSGSISNTATSAQSPGQGGPLFGIAQIQKLRILVAVPEGYATSIHAGQRAPVAFQEYQGVPFYGEITGTSDSIDPNTRTMLTELQIDNSANKLVPGMYAVVTFPPAPGVMPPLLINGDAVLIRNDEPTVATVVNGKIRIVPVTLGRDFGTDIEILTGLKGGDTIVTQVTDSVVNDAAVTIDQQKSPGAQSQSQSQPPKQNVPPGGSTQYSNDGLTDQNVQGKQSQQNQKTQGKGKSKGQSPQKRNSTESKQ